MSESQGGAAACSDTVDNDNDMLIDCADPDCFQIGSCRAPAPTMSARLTVLLIGMLTLAGIYQARRRRAH